jgi:hypothetical protein
VRRALPCHIYVPIVLKSGSLKLLEPSGSVKACNGIAFTIYLLAYEDGTGCSETLAFKPDAGDSSRRKHTTFRTRRKFEIKKNALINVFLHTIFHNSNIYCYILIIFRELLNINKGYTGNPRYTRSHFTRFRCNAS